MTETSTGSSSTDPRGDRQRYVADTKNHAIRQVDWSNGKVTTLAGTGVQARVFNVAGTEVVLNSPWDLIAREKVLYIAMAGSHQLWQPDRIRTGA